MSKSEYKQCHLSVLDNISDSNIEFDEKGISNYYYNYKKEEKILKEKISNGNEYLRAMTDEMKSSSSQYDCIIGLSGGVDSTYLCLLAKRLDLNPLVVHFDNGWNSELAVRNIHNTIEKLGFDLYTYVVDWNEFKELQLAYIRASVVDIEVLTDQAFMAVLYSQAKKYKIKYVLAGMNSATEYIMPSDWNYIKSDIVNIKDIYQKNSDSKFSKLKTYPVLSYFTKQYCERVLKIKVYEPLNYVHYEYNEVKKTISEELDWVDYGGKHFESVWTRFYQGYILPNKFKIDKRKAHLSNLVFSNQITKEQAIKLLSNSPYPSEELLIQDKEFVFKKLGLSEVEFENLMSEQPVSHFDYETYMPLSVRYPALKMVKNLLRL